MPRAQGEPGTGSNRRARTRRSAVPGLRRGCVDGSPFRRIQAVHEEWASSSLLDRQLLPAFGAKPLDRIAPAQVTGDGSTGSAGPLPGNANHAASIFSARL